MWKLIFALLAIIGIAEVGRWLWLWLLISFVNDLKRAVTKKSQPFLCYSIKEIVQQFLTPKR